MEQTPFESMLSEQRKDDLSRRQQEIEFKKRVVYWLLEIIILLAQYTICHSEVTESLNLLKIEETFLAC